MAVQIERAVKACQGRGHAKEIRTSTDSSRFAEMNLCGVIAYNSPFLNRIGSQQVLGLGSASTRQIARAGTVFYEGFISRWEKKPVKTVSYQS